MGTTTSYVPYDYRRTCDLCGNLYNISKMFKKGPYTYCSDHAGERISEELDRGNARQRPFRILPVPNAKPEDQTQPDVFESEESVVWNLLDFVTPAGARYAQVDQGEAAPLPNAADVLPTNGWACRFYYMLATATYPKGHVDVWHAQALARMRTSADRILALQNTTGTRATNAFYGGLLGTGASFYYSEDASVGGLALLYAYRLLGDVKYLYGARACASFLRNCQAVGSDAVNFTSSDSAGTARLNTGGIVNSVSTVSGFYSDGLFYPSGLLALQFWNELKLTDGDQSIGATAAIASNFTTAPAKQLTDAMAQLRAFWINGTRDFTTQTVQTGLSATTPREYFNSFPAVKTNTNVSGSGSWEYQDGISSNGTLVSGLNFAKALAAVYAVDGLTAQVQAVDNWLQTFTSNAAFETPTGTSAQTLQRSTTGTYDPTQGIAQLLLVRDPTTLAATAKNGGSLYDWGAFGLLAPLWSVRHAYGFKLGRIAATVRRRRFSDGLPSDGHWDDRGFERGRQGLSFQTGFREVLAHAPSETPQAAQTVTAPPSENLVLWFKSDAGVTVDGTGQVTDWADQGPNHWDVHNKNSVGSTIVGPQFVASKINGLPGIYYSDTGPGTAVGALNHFRAAGEAVTAPIPTAYDAPRTLLSLFMRDNTYGGIVFTCKQTGTDYEFGLWNNSPSELYGFVSSANGTLLNDLTAYQNQAAVMSWTWFGYAMPVPIVINVNGVNKAYAYSGALQVESGVAGFSIGNVTSVGSSRGFSGWITEVIMYSGTDPATLAQARAYLQQRAGLYSSALIYDGLAAAQFGLSMQYQPRA